MIPSRFLCQACSAGNLREIEGFGRLPRVTSDSKPFRAGGRLFVCTACGLVQKIADPAWLAEIGEIYRDYDMYHQSGAIDQPVFDPQSGVPSGRCDVLARRLRESGALPASGSLLDVGAGSGAMLGAFSAACPGWKLFGLDLDERKLPALKAIARFERLFTVPPEQLQQRFDLITLIHSLEHFTDPLRMLSVLRDRLAPAGRLFVQVNNAERTAFDLIVADHLCHFDTGSLAHMAAQAGLAIKSLATDWVNKEISLVARTTSPSPPVVHGDPAATVARTGRDVAWLSRMLDHARESARAGRFGIFGTSVAATWLASGLGDVVEFFVDEDPARQGRSLLGRPILAPAQVPSGSVVYLAFVREAAAAIRRRLSSLPVEFAAPEAISGN
jgi:2-polyprenyl-3-methyl-5-hydroxy-6-metoxy-1,4-benzoquinol methylase